MKGAKLHSKQMKGMGEGYQCGAGIMPFTYNVQGSEVGKEGISFLFQIPSKGKKQNCYVDFGGWRDPSDTDIIANAAREFSEETLGLLYPYLEIKNSPEFEMKDFEDNAKIEEKERIKRCQEAVEEILRSGEYISKYQSLSHPISGYTFFFLPLKKQFDIHFLQERFINTEKQRQFVWVDGERIIDQCEGILDNDDNAINLFIRIKVDQLANSIRSISEGIRSDHRGNVQIKPL